MKKVVITGANGFIARHCIEEFKKHDYTVLGTVRSRQHADDDEVLSSIKLIEADLLSDHNWQEAFSDADAVIHTASPVLLNGKEKDLIAPAVEGTQRVLRFAAEAGVKRIVLTSSTAAIVNCDADVYTEEHWSELSRCSAYPKSKTLAEKAAWSFIQSLPEHNRPELVTCNPCVVFGPLLSNTVPESVSVIEKLLLRKLPAIPKIGFSVVDVRDVARAHRLALETPEADGNRYLLSGEFFWLPDIAQTLQAAFADAGYKPTTRVLPKAILNIAALFHPLARTARDSVGERSYHDTRKAQTELGWEARCCKQSIIETAQSLIDRKLL